MTEPNPKKVLQNLLTARRAESAKEFKARKERFEERSRLTRLITKPYGQLIPAEQHEEALKAVKKRTKLARTPRSPVKPPKLEKFEPHVTGGSILSVLVPPYINFGPEQNGPNIDVISDGADAFAYIWLSPPDGSANGQAGLLARYSPISNMPWGLLRPYIKYDYIYGDVSYNGYTAHTTGTLTVSVYEWTGQFGISQVGSYQKTLWEGDASSWPQDSDGGAVPPYQTLNGPLEPVYYGFVEVPFQIAPGKNYILAVMIGATGDNDGEDFFGASASTAQLSIQVPLMVVEEAMSR
jgi:hypothetical protein